MDLGTVILIVILIVIIVALFIWCMKRGLIVLVGYPTGGGNNGQGNNGQGNNGQANNGGNNGQSNNDQSNNGQGNNGGASNITNSNSTANTNVNANSNNNANFNSNANVNTPTPLTLNTQLGQPSPPHQNIAGDQGQSNQGQGKYDLQLSEGGDSLFKPNLEKDSIGTLIEYTPNDKSQANFKANSKANSHPNFSAKQLVNSGYQWTDPSIPQYPEPSRDVQTAHAYGGSQVITGGRPMIPEAAKAMGFNGEIPVNLQYKTA